MKKVKHVRELFEDFKLKHGNMNSIQPYALFSHAFSAGYKQAIKEMGEKKVESN